MLSCPRCASHIPKLALGCPLCHSPLPDTEIRPAAVLLLGLAAACDKDDTGLDPQPAYGVTVVDTGGIDNDGDGYAESDGDCDDTDATIHPDAEETAGDGIDSNCNGEDDT